MTTPLHMQVGLLMGDMEARNFLASQWGKKGTSTDLSLFTLSSSELVQTTITPEGYPKKPLSLVFSAHMADVLVVGIPMTGLDASVGEAAILSHYLDIPGVVAVVGEHANGMQSYLDKLDKIFSNIKLKAWERKLVYDGLGASEVKNILTEHHPGPRNSADDYLAIEVDHAFPVQGVGSVVLGTVVSGTVEKGQAVRAFPENQQGTVRSIQVNDVEERSASVGTHVGLALKGILPKYLQRGTVITGAKDDAVDETDEYSFKPVPLVLGKPRKPRSRVHVVSGLFDSPGEIVEWNSNLTVKLDKKIPVHPTTRISLLDLNAKPSIITSNAVW